MALGGGGAKGLCHIAFVKALDEMGLRPSVIAGTSIGAVVGALYAAGLSGERMADIVRAVDLMDIGRMMDFSILNMSGMVKGKGVEDFLCKYVPARRFEELPTPLKVVATDFWGRREVVLDSGELIPAIRASISMPAIFRPVRVGDRILVDGGAVNPLPYDIIQRECDITVAIDVSGEKAPPDYDPTPNMFECLLSTFQIMQAAIVESKMRISRPDIYIKPALTNIRVLQFDRYEEIMEGVLEDTQRLKHDLSRAVKRRFRLL